MIDEDFTQPILLMEAMPSLLAKRDFDPPLTLRMVEPGFRDSPDPEHNMAIAFVKASKGQPCRRGHYCDALRQTAEDDHIECMPSHAWRHMGQSPKLWV